MFGKYILEKQLLTKNELHSKGFFASFPMKLLALFLIFLFFLAGCQKKEKKAPPPPKPLLVQFKLEKFNFYAENLPDEAAQNRTAQEMADFIQSFYNSLYFNPDNFKKEANRQVAAEYFNSLALKKFQAGKIAIKSLFKIKPFLRKIMLGQGKIENLGIYQDKNTNDFIGVAEAEIKAVYLLSDGKKVELVHQGEFVLKGQTENFKIEEFKFNEKVKTHEKPKKKE